MANIINPQHEGRKERYHIGRETYKQDIRPKKAIRVWRGYRTIDYYLNAKLESNRGGEEDSDGKTTSTQDQKSILPSFILISQQDILTSLI